MTCDFGYNCKHYLPTLQKCRKLIDRYCAQKNLVELRWFGTQDTLVYLKLSKDALIDGILSGEIRVKRHKNQNLVFGVLVAADFDDCYLKDSGGVCLYFEQHHGRPISCLADIKRESEHPNSKDIPSDSDIKVLEVEVAAALLERPDEHGAI